jgi:hypothetical protein
MTANTILADINEIYLGYYLNNQKTFDKDAEQQLLLREGQAKQEEISAQSEKAKIMAEEVIRWAKAHKYSGKIKKVWWTARPGVLQSAVGKDVDSKKNPTDILIQFSDGKFLGISAKATKSRGDIGFKNPGMGTIEKDLKIKLQPIIKKFEEEAIKKFKLPPGAAARKQAIRKSKTTQVQTQALGSQALKKVRDVLFKKLQSLNQTQLRKYILTGWMDANVDLFPPYIKVTGMGSKSPFTAKVEDPLRNNKLTALNENKISLEKIGNESIGIKAGSQKILKMRVKYESEKLASSVKFSGDPW